MSRNIDSLLRLMVEKKASDLHISAGAAIQIRVDEKLDPVDDHILSPEESRELSYSILAQEQIKRFEHDLELDMSFGVKGLGRFRTNVFKQRGSICSAIRLIPYDIWTFEQCGLPVNVVTNLCKTPKGLVLVTGATGSGKTTSLASMIDWINNDRKCHIVTIEDPIEFIHSNKKSIVHQREIYSDTHSFSNALRHVLRQDPNVILIGELRDLETIESDCVQTINRVIDVFPAHQQEQVRTQLSFILVGILSQQLIPRLGQKGRVLAVEILLANTAIRSLIRESKAHQIYSVLQTSQKDGMKTMNQALYELYRNKLISYEDAFARTIDPEDLSRLFRK
jgi:twitching motility protein PilT